MVDLGQYIVFQDDLCPTAFELRAVWMDVTEPKAQVVIFQTIDHASARLGLRFGYRHQPFHQMKLLQGVQVSGCPFNPGGLLDFIQAGLASCNSLQNCKVVARLAQLLL